MRNHEHDALGYYTFQTFPTDKVIHAVFGRTGGVSPAPWDTLNMSTSTGDSLRNVRRNRVRAFNALQLPVESMVTLWQVHGAKTIIVGDEFCNPDTKGDALITNRPEVSLFLRFADCVPILLVDPVKRAIGMAHAGWRGLVSGVTQATVQAMASSYGCRPDNIIAGIGPSVGPLQYNIGPDVTQAVKQAFSESHRLLIHRQGLVHLDLWEASSRALKESGVHAIETAGLCTATHVEQFFSHRGENGRTGRFGAVIALRT